MGESSIDNLPAVSDADRTALLAYELFKNPLKNPNEIAREIGYSETSIEKGYITRKIKSPKVQETFDNIALGKDYRMVAIEYGLQEMAYKTAFEQSEIDSEQEVEERKNIALATLAKLKHTSKQKMVRTGLLLPDPGPGSTTINLVNIRQYLQSKVDDSGDSVEGEIIDE
jgi:hypothetical protein